MVIAVLEMRELAVYADPQATAWCDQVVLEMWHANMCSSTPHLRMPARFRGCHIRIRRDFRAQQFAACRSFLAGLGSCASSRNMPNHCRRAGAPMNGIRSHACVANDSCCSPMRKRGPAS
jgi:hypothetical protein